MAHTLNLTSSSDQKVKKLARLFWVHSIVCIASFLLSVCGFVWMDYNLEGDVWSERNFRNQFGMLYVVCGLLSPIAYIITAYAGTILLKNHVGDIKRYNSGYNQLPYLQEKKRLLSQIELVNRYMVVVVYSFFFGADLSNRMWEAAYVFQLFLYLIMILWYIIAFGRLADRLRAYHLTYYLTPKTPQFDDVERHVLE